MLPDFVGPIDGSAELTRSSHLAAFYAQTYPDRLRYIPIPAAEPFGQEIAMAPTVGRDTPLAEPFQRFFLAARYPAGGFGAAESFAYGRELVLAPRWLSIGELGNRL